MSKPIPARPHRGDHSDTTLRWRTAQRLSRGLAAQTVPAGLRVDSSPESPSADLPAEPRLTMQPAYPLPPNEIGRQLGKGPVAGAYRTIYDWYLQVKALGQEQEAEALALIDEIMTRVPAIIPDTSQRPADANCDLALSLAVILEYCASRPLEAQGRAMEAGISLTESDEASINRARRICDYLWVIVPNPAEAVDRIIRLAEVEVLAFDASTIIADLMLRRELALTSEQAKAVAEVYSLMGDLYLAAMRGEVEGLEMPDDYIFDSFELAIRRGVTEQVLLEKLVEAVRFLTDQGRPLGLILGLSGRVVRLLPDEEGSVFPVIAGELTTILRGVDASGLEAELPLDGQYELAAVQDWRGLLRIRQLLPEEIAGHLAALSDRSMEQTEGYLTPAHFNELVEDQELREQYGEVYSGIQAAETDRGMRLALEALGRFVQRLGQGASLEEVPRASVLSIAVLLEEYFVMERAFRPAERAAQHSYQLSGDSADHVERVLAISEAEAEVSGRSILAFRLLGLAGITLQQQDMSRIVAIFKKNAAHCLKRADAGGFARFFYEAEVFLMSGNNHSQQTYQLIADAVDKAFEISAGDGALPCVRRVWGNLSTQTGKWAKGLKARLQKTIAAGAGQLTGFIAGLPDVEEITAYRALLEEMGVINNSPPAHLAFGHAYHRLGALDQAQEVFTQVRRRSGHLAEPCIGEAAVLESKGDLAEALAMYREAKRRGGKVTGEIERVQREITLAKAERARLVKQLRQRELAWAALLETNEAEQTEKSRAFLTRVPSEERERFLNQKIRETLRSNPKQAYKVYASLVCLEAEAAADPERLAACSRLINCLFDGLFEKVELGRVILFEERMVFYTLSSYFFKTGSAYALSAERLRRLEDLSQQQNHTHRKLAERMLMLGENLQDTAPNEIPGILKHLADFFMQIHSLNEARSVSAQIKSAVEAMVRILESRPVLARIEALSVAIMAEELLNNGFGQEADQLSKTLPLSPSARMLRSQSFLLAFYNLGVKYCSSFESSGELTAYDQARSIFDLIEANLPTDEEAIMVAIQDCPTEISLRSALETSRGALHLAKAYRLAAADESENEYASAECEAEYDLAATTFRRALADPANPGQRLRNPVARLELATVMLTRREPVEAQRLLLQALEISPRYFRLYIKLCDAYLAQEPSEGFDPADPVRETLKRCLEQLSLAVGDGQAEKEIGTTPVLRLFVGKLCQLYVRVPAREIEEIMGILQAQFGLRVSYSVLDLIRAGELTIPRALQPFVTPIVEAADLLG